MSIELTMLVWSVILAFVQVMIPAIENNGIRNGLGWAMGNRDTSPETSVWNKRAVRARNNMYENLLLFAILVLTARTANISNAQTVLGTQIFFYSRLAYAIIYLTGIPYVRTLGWLGGIVGMAMILFALV